jgi:outer membrane immunogenic protein
MKHFKLAASLFVSLASLSSSTYAHNVYKDAPVALAPYNWTGFYAGVNLGFVNHTLDITDNNATSFLATIQQVSNPYFTGGFQLGYRRQLDLTHVAGVYGLEFGANFSDASYNKEYGSPFALYQLTTKNNLKDALMLQIIGGIAADRTLLFIAGGLSWTNITGSVSNQIGTPFLSSFNLNQKSFGTAFGGGIEYGFSDAFSVRFKIDIITPDNYTVNDDSGNNFQITNSIVQGTVGLNYKFW